MRRRIIAGLLAINLIIGLPVTDTFAGQSIVQVQTDTAGDQLNGEQTETDKDAAASTEKDKTEEIKGTETVEA